MTKKKQRVGMLIALRETLGDIEFDAESQTTEILRGNLILMRDHVADILALDGISFVRADSKVDVS